ncbi:uncharacterized protein LOC136089950 [Hydra vulgaris]|uniref:Uncharacterized protein LOC136089950 n=1 Tax=Hydra vulgaris TaxID=6087 RepID=A0ABM4DCJ8_HYDVU
MASKLTNIIISKVLKSTYYSIIADCTPDVSHKEQLSLTIRIVNISEYPIKINKHFHGFFNVKDTTGLGLTEIIIGALKDFGLNKSFCRGQGYDNGANMKGKKVGLQKRILDLNPLAFYLPCGSHSLNLNDLLKLCKQLQEKLTVNTKSEIDGALLCDELISVQFFIKAKLSNVENEINTKEMTPLFELNFVKKHFLQELYSNTWIVLRILLTIPVTVASGERSFSKLKLFKTFKKYHVTRST